MLMVHDILSDVFDRSIHLMTRVILTIRIHDGTMVDFISMTHFNVTDV